MKRISLTQDKMALVDDIDYESLKCFRWCAAKGRCCYYAVRSIKTSDSKWLTTRMHRVILNAPYGIEVDHRNGNGLDNRRCNLRLCTRTENGRHQRLLSANKTGFKGVSKTRQNLKKPFYVSIKVNLRSINLGYYRTSGAAARAYDIAAIKYHDRFALTNKMLGLLS